MAQISRISRAIDPDTRDYTLVKGERKVDATLQSQVLFFMLLEENSSPAFPGMGSRFHKMQKITDDFDIELQQETERCLKPLLDAGLISELSPTVTITEHANAPDDVKLNVAFVDPTTKTPETLSVAVSF